MSAWFWTRVEVELGRMCAGCVQFDSQRVSVPCTSDSRYASLFVSFAGFVRPLPEANSRPFVGHLLGSARYRSHGHSVLVGMPWCRLMHARCTLSAVVLVATSGTSGSNSLGQRGPHFMQYTCLHDTLLPLGHFTL